MALAAGIGVAVIKSSGSAPSQSPPVALDKPQEQPKEVKTYTPHYEGNDLKLHPGITKPAPDQDARVFAVNEYLTGLKVVPKAARATKCEIKDGVATIDFTPEFETTYGTEDEQTILKGLLTTMAQFKGVEKVRFTVQGHTLETLGNVDLTEPQPVMQEEAPSSPSKASPQIQ